jgi:hypothetical protein
MLAHNQVQMRNTANQSTAIDEVTCPLSLFATVSGSQPLRFNTCGKYSAIKKIFAGRRAPGE